MNATKFIGVLAIAALAAVAACKKVRPILPKTPVPPGTFQIRFTKKIRGPMDLVIDGVRIPVEQKTKKARTLTVSGLSEGKHQYHISCRREAVGPDVGEIEIVPSKGIFQVHFSQRLKTTIYTSDDTPPAAEGIPGVKAVLE
jgi:hypothetical protein